MDRHSVRTTCGSGWLIPANRSLPMSEINRPLPLAVLTSSTAYCTISHLTMLHGKSIICFGGEDWWYHHPHSKNHLMRRFARAGNKVIFVNSIFMGLPSLVTKDFLA